MHPGVSKFSQRKGKYGRNKFLAFSILSGLPGEQYLSVRQLCLCSGISYYSLARALSKWTRWQYVERYPTTTFGEGDFMYRLAPKGIEWLSFARQELPNARLFEQCLEEWQSQVMVQDKFEEMRKLPFKTFVSELHTLVARD